MKGDFLLKKKYINFFYIILTFIISIHLFSFDGQNVIYKKILDEYNPNSKDIKIELHKDDMTFTGKKGSATIIFTDNEIDNLIIKHRVRTKEDIVTMENFIANIIYYTNGDRELINGHISNETAKEYNLDISSRLSGKGIFTKIIDIVTLNRFRGILTDDRREKEVKIILIRKKR